MIKLSTQTFGDGDWTLFDPCSCRPLLNQVTTAGGLLMAVSHFSLITSPALACWWPLIVTFLGATTNTFHFNPFYSQTKDNSLLKTERAVVEELVFLPVQFTLYLPIYKSQSHFKNKTLFHIQFFREMEHKEENFNK